jgi:hypothetical protein
MILSYLLVPSLSDAIRCIPDHYSVKFSYRAFVNINKCLLRITMGREYRNMQPLSERVPNQRLMFGRPVGYNGSICYDIGSSLLSEAREADYS